MQKAQIILQVSLDIAPNILAFLDKFSKKDVQILAKKIAVDDVLDNTQAKLGKRQQQLGILSDYKADLAFYEPLDKGELTKW